MAVDKIMERFLQFCFFMGVTYLVLGVIAGFLVESGSGESLLVFIVIVLNIIVVGLSALFTRILNKRNQ